MTLGRRLVAVVADDDPAARDYLKGLLEEAGVEVAALAEDGDAALAAVRAARPDAVFLDVQMPRRSGIQVVQALARDELPVVVITTAFPEFALDSFEIAAADFLVKPFDERRLARSLERVTAIVDGRFGAELRRRLAAPAGWDQAAPAARRGLAGRLPCRVAGKIRFVDVADIESITAADEAVFLHLREGQLLARESISAIEARTRAHGFVRIHRSTVINPAFVREIASLGGGEHQVTMLSGMTLRASSSYKDAVRALAEGGAPIG